MGKEFGVIYHGIKGILMENNMSILQKCPLFSGLSCEEIQQLCVCLGVREKTEAKNTFIFRAGDKPRLVYLILSGSMDIVDEDFLGNRSIIETLERYVLFGEAYVFASTAEYLVSVVTAEDSTFLEIEPRLLFETCPKNCACHHELVKNTRYILAEKVVRLTEKLGHIIKRSIREKILSYLSHCARQAESNSFDTPYTRQQLADYLCVDRSALSHELSKMQKLKIIRYNKNHFELLMWPDGVS